MPRVIGEALHARDENGRRCVRIATVFPKTQTVITTPGTHATQRIAYVDVINDDRIAGGLKPLTEEQEEVEWMQAVDLVLDDDAVLIRPDPANMKLAFEADELLQEIVSKKEIKFLHVLEHQVREAIKRRGECWRINPLPRSPEEMKEMIAGSKIGIGGRELYYYNKTSGVRVLTYDQFSSLGFLSDHELRKHLLEVKEYCQQTNRRGNPEIAFFESRDGTVKKAFVECHVADLDSSDLLAAYQRLRKTFHDSVPLDFRQDNADSPQWRSRMYATLIGQTDKAVSEEALLGLSAEFFMQMNWVPGGRVEDGELILDPVFEEEDANTCHDRICDDTARGFIFNFIRDYGDLEYVNVGRVTGALSSRKVPDGRRGVYLADIKQRGNDQNILRIVRMQKWGVAEHLDEGKDLLSAILEAEDYTEYILDRRLGCRQLGMALSARATSRKVIERYTGRNSAYYGTSIWSAYFERDYIPGLATDKIPSGRFADPEFAIRFARLMGRAAAPNLILGRCHLNGRVVFDDGDELLIEDSRGLPIDMMVADHTGTFVDYQRDLRETAPSYGTPVTRRAALVPDPEAFALAYLEAFAERFKQIQHEYRKRRRAFDTLFKHKRRDEGGSFAYRWERVLKRLEASDVAPLKERVAEGIRVR